jgi:phosphoribosylanthranilate isomerase
MRTRIKICGFTRAEDAIFASALGVDAIGLVFYSPSPRNISIAQADSIVRKLPAFVSIVALFVNETEKLIRAVLDQIHIDILQFHGTEPPEHCRLYNKPYIKAVQMHSELNLVDFAAAYYDAAAILVDAYHPDAKGGTGHQFDWGLLPEGIDFPLILAGGLDAKNVSSAMSATNPYALDVSSGVEMTKGIKDPGKMKQFVEQVYHGDKSKLR